MIFPPAEAHACRKQYNQSQGQGGIGGGVVVCVGANGASGGVATTTGGTVLTIGLLDY